MRSPITEQLNSDVGRILLQLLCQRAQVRHGMGGIYRSIGGGGEAAAGEFAEGVALRLQLSQSGWLLC